MRKILIWIFSVLCINYAAWADIATTQQNLSALESQGIANATDPKIHELYNQLKSRIKSYDQVEQEYMNDLRENATAMKDKEQSTENKLLGAVGIGGVGLGAMQMASGMAEQNADAIAEEDMRAYLATFTCRYGNGLSVRGGETNIETPTSPDLSSLYSEYVSLADSIKTRKSALEMTPGIESELILSSASTDLYNNVATGKTDGAFTSLSQAILNPSGPDADEWTEQTDNASKKKNTGLQIAGTALVGSAVANLAINQDAPQERSAEIKTEYENKRQKLESEISDLESQLNTAIAANKKRIAEFNDLLAQHQKLVKTISDGEFCHDKFAQYITDINNLKPITNDFADTSEIPEIPYDLSTQQSAYEDCVSAEKIEQARTECNAKPGYEWNDTTKTCVEKPEELTFDDTETAPIATPDSETSEPEPDESICPDTGNQAPGLNSRFKRGDSCSYWHVTNGYVTKANKPGSVCGCFATACQAGYTVHNGMCACPRHTFTKETGKNDTTETCNAQCKKHCNSGQCTFVESQVTDTHCICNPNDFDKNPAPKSASASQPTAQPASLDDLYYTHACLGFGLPTITKRDPKTGKDVKKQWGRKLCFDSVFDDTQVTAMEASTLAKEYLRIHYGMTNVKCFDDDKYIRQDGNDDYMACTSPDATSDQYTGPTYFDFHFDDIYESWDADRILSLTEAICKIYRREFDYTMYGDDMWCEVGSSPKQYSSLVDRSKTISEYDAIIETASRFGLKGTHSYNGKVYFSRSAPTHYTTNKIAGINPFAFFSTDNQFRNSSKIIDILYNYSALQMNVAAFDSFECNSSPQVITGSIDGQSTRGPSDDVLTCRINGKPVDFVFDDMSESNKTTSDGAYDYMACTAVGGKNDGSKCLGMTEMTCQRIAKLTGQSATWNPKTQSCDMPAAAAAMEDRQLTKITIMVAGAVVAAVATVVTMGGATAVILVVAGTVGTAMAAQAENDIYNAINDFLNTAAQCQQSDCAESILKSSFSRMQNFANDMQPSQLEGADYQLARLLDLLPPESKTYQNIQKNGSIQLDPSNTNWSSWEDEEVMRAVGDALGLIDVAGSVIGIVKAIVTKGVKVFSSTAKALAKIKSAGKTSTALVKYGDNAANAADDFAKAASKADDAAKAGARAGANATHNISADDLARATDPNQGFRLTPETLTANQKAKDIITGNMHMIDELAKTGENVLYINRTHLDGNDIKAITKRFKDLGYTADFSGGGATIKFYKSVDNASDMADAAKSTRTATNAAESAANVADNFTPVRQRVMDNLTKYNNSGTNTAILKSELTDAQWAKLNNELISQNVRMVEHVNPQNGKIYMKFERITPANPTSASAATRGADNVADAARSIAQRFPGNDPIGNGFYMSSRSYTAQNAEQVARSMMDNAPDVVAKAVPMTGTSNGQWKIVSALGKELEQSGAILRNGDWVRYIDNSDFLTKLQRNFGKEITRIGRTPVVIEDVGSVGGRGIVMVRVGGKKIPFYVSSGMAGKVDVPTGKWEAFFGLGPDNWFNKGSVQDILSHYDSAELKHIANKLDDLLGDPRSYEDILATAGRRAEGGIGSVAEVDLGAITNQQINASFLQTSSRLGSKNAMRQNVEDIKAYLKKLGSAN